MRVASEVFRRRPDAAPEQQGSEPEPLNESVLTLHPRDIPASRSELERPIWSVICFDGVKAGGLTYARAVDVLKELDSRGIPGLCVVTDQAAERAAR